LNLKTARISEGRPWKWWSSDGWFLFFIRICKNRNQKNIPPVFL